MTIDTNATYVAINKHGKEVNVLGNIVQDVIKKDFVVVAQIIDGVRQELPEPLTRRPVAKKLFSKAWESKAEKEANEVKTAGERALEEEKLYCLSCGFTTNQNAALVNHSKSHNN